MTRFMSLGFCLCAGALLPAWGGELRTAAGVPPYELRFDSDQRFTLGAATTPGYLMIDGLSQSSRFDAIARLPFGDPFAVRAIDRGEGLQIELNYGRLGSLSYLLSSSGVQIETTIQSVACAALRDAPLNRAVLELVQTIFAQAASRNPSPELEQETRLAARLTAFLSGTDLSADCVSGVRVDDSWGCDRVLESCGPHGKCCDDHDECFARHGCTDESWACLKGDDFLSRLLCQAGGGEPCGVCNARAVFCAMQMPGPGPSECCAKNICGKERQQF